jgi:uncharacterized membrane protein YjgN (DUF898 family)
MSIAEPIASPPDRADRGGARFLSESGPFWRLLLRGAGLMLVTLGVYRFWLVTDIRRFLWGHTEIAGDVIEYLGTARELLLGFLMAVVVLAPIDAAFVFAAIDLGPLGRVCGILGLVLLLVLGQFAVYRARRYRLTRTLFRGLKFHQTGSSWRYAACAVLWWTVIGLTLGLAYPWARASLERYKMRHTFYGDLQGRFASSGTGLFIRGVPLWLLIVAPTLASLMVTVYAVDWGGVAEAVNRGDGDVVGRIEGANPGFAAAILSVVLAAVWGLVAAAILYPAFQAIVLRWWLSGLRFGVITTTSRLRVRSLYAIYTGFLGQVVVLGAIIGLAAAALFFLIKVAGQAFALGDTTETLATATALALYVVAALGYSTLYQVGVKLRLWRLGLESVELAGLSALNGVKAAEQTSSALGEGLADALHVGGY